MKDNKFINTLSRTCNRVMFSAKKHSPEICLVGAFVTGAIGIAFVVKKSMALPAVLDENKERVAEIKAASEEISVKEERKELAKAYTHTGVQIAKLYVGPAVLFVTSAGLVLTSHGIIKGRNAALSAAYAGLSTTFNSYRDRVAERYGKEAEEEIRYGITTKTVKEKVVDENGETQTVKSKVSVVTPGPESDYIRYLTPSNPNWENDSDYMELFFNRTQRYANDILRSRGYLYLNTVYEMMALKQSKAGHQVGWVYRKDNPEGDNQVVLTIKKVQIPRSADPEDGYQQAYLIDFNVDGDIYNRMDDEDYFEQ